MKRTALARAVGGKSRGVKLAIAAAATIGLALTTAGMATSASAAPAAGHASVTPTTAAHTTVAAAAATVDYVEFFYSPDCTNASHLYTGVHTQEPWINDTFNRTENGSAGVGQGVYENAASFYVYGGPNASVTVWGADGTSHYWWSGVTGGQTVSACNNLGSLRNQNTYFSFGG